ncbi:ankyrin domain protein [Cordyceps fumosorosea ARSEF 2679]|uniref:Ankyrin domain protein n=1 Tax=Cordyceps fumosorosea (strain ARSEF 2679) TaxID=1081104 RepID=A0A162LLT5_CORFA|nr:ankyrin domain protein [Cordyceps fumosorosea ARSEF 2679]OAA72514.1 ankyrin domain protein [Cordyceps fumosorosea ARSEF 2679]
MQQLLAVYDDDVPKLREHVAAGEPYINYCDAQFGSALQLAVNCDDMTALSTTATFPPDNLDTPYEGPRGLDYTHQQQIIHLLIDAGADPNGRGLNKKATALHHLGGPVYVNNGPECHLHEKGIRVLLDHGASVLERDTENNTSLHYAASGSNMRIFSLLASKLPPDTDVSVINLENSSGETLLHCAAADSAPVRCRAVKSYLSTPRIYVDTEEDIVLAKLAADLVTSDVAMLPVSALYDRHSLRGGHA